MSPKGSVLLKKEFIATKIWPNPQLTMSGWRDLEKEYKEALSGKMCTVISIAVDGSNYLVLGKLKGGADFIWAIQKEDALAFIPLIKKHGVIIPAGLDPIEEAYFMANHMTSNADKYAYPPKNEK